MSRRVELIAGLLIGVAGGIGWVLALLVALSSNAPEGLDPRAAIYFVVMILCVIGVTAGASLRLQRGAIGVPAQLWVCTIPLIIGAVISGFTVGVYFLPVALLALVASVARSFAPPAARTG